MSVTKNDLDAARNNVKECVSCLRPLAINLQFMTRRFPEPSRAYRTEYPAEKIPEQVGNLYRELGRKYVAARESLSREVIESIMLARGSAGETYKGTTARTWHEIGVILTRAALEVPGEVLIVNPTAPFELRCIDDGGAEVIGDILGRARGDDVFNVWLEISDRLDAEEPEEVLLGVDDEWARASSLLEGHNDDWSQAKSPAEWSKIFGISEKTFRRMRDDGRITADEITSKQVRIRRCDVKKFAVK